MMPGIDANTVLMLHNDTSGFIDSSIYAQTTAASSGCTLDTVTKKFGIGSASCDNTANGKLTITDAANLRFGAGAFCIDGWFYLAALPGAGLLLSLISKRASGDGAGTSWIIFVDENGKVNLNNFGTTIKTSSAALSTSVFTHIEWDRDGSGNNYLFIGGTLDVGSFSDSSNYSVTNPILVGRDFATNNIAFKSDEIRLSNVLRNSASFTPLVVPYDSYSGFKLEVSDFLIRGPTEVVSY